MSDRVAKYDSINFIINKALKASAALYVLHASGESVIRHYVYEDYRNTWGYSRICKCGTWSIMGESIPQTSVLYDALTSFLPPFLWFP